jgi:hypothetical protein
MMKRFTFLILTICLFTAVISCVKPPEAIDNLKKSCLYDEKTDYFKKWTNSFTEIITTDNGGSVHSKTIYPLGYFWINNDGSYSTLSNFAPKTGKWDVTDSCKFVLDPGRHNEREFDVVKLTTDSLVLSRKQGKTVYIQHYAAFNCFDISKIVTTWDNTQTEIQYYSDSTYYSEYIFPVGYFKLEANTNYIRLSNGDYLSGKWSVDNDCHLVLDKGKNLERAFEVQKLTADSLVIWRKDTVAHANYLQKYVKH